MKYLLPTLCLPALLSACIIHIDTGEWEASEFNWTDELDCPVAEDLSAEDLAGVRALSIEGDLDVQVRVGENEHVILAGTRLDKVAACVSGNTLELGLRQDATSHGVRLEVLVPSLSALAVSGSSDVEVTGVHSDHLAVSISGSGDLVVEGQAEHLAAQVSGSGEAHLAGLVARNASVAVSGSGEISVHATDSLDAAVSGSGEVHHVGGGHVDAAVSGSGSVQSD